MNNLLWSCAALFTLFVTVESLSCYTCDTTVFGYCLHTEPKTCTKTEQCFSGVAKFSNDHFSDIHSKGCTAPANCKNSTSNILDVKYSITMNCCKTDMCNGAASIQMSLTTAVGAALVAIWTRWSL